MSEADKTIKVGYVGLGIMGAAMAANLLKAGYELIVWNRTSAKAQPLAKLGATVADSPADVAVKGAAIIFINVTDTPDVEAVIFGPDGIATAAAAGTIIVDNSTINPVATKQFAERLAEQGLELLDAPVSGGDIGARQGTLSIMVGGSQPAFDRCLPLLEALGKSITHLGPVGMGQTCKACNQIAVSLNLLGTCEAMALAKGSGLDLKKMIQVLAGGDGRLGTQAMSKVLEQLGQFEFGAGAEGRE
jgi:3-hydroxyisobutyrate dehydrogenase